MEWFIDCERHRWPFLHRDDGLLGMTRYFYLVDRSSSFAY